MKGPVILHLMNDFEDASISRIVERLLRHSSLVDLEWHVGSMANQGRMCDSFAARGAHIADFSESRQQGRNVTAEIREYINNHHVDLVHSHTPRTLLAAARALFHNKQANSKVIHVATKHILNAPKDRRWGLLYTLFDRATLYMPDHLVAVSQKIRDQICATPFIRPGRVTVIKNAIDCIAFYKPEQRLACRAEFGFGDGCFVVGSAGRLEKVKRFDLLLEAFSLILKGHPEGRLLIIGEGQLRRELENLASELGISHAVVFTGYRDDVPQLLAAMDIYAQTSVNEGLSLSVLEAMAAEKPVVVTDVGGAREVITDNTNGIIIPPLSVAAIHEAIIHLMEMPELRLRLARSGKDHAFDNYNNHRMVQSYHDLYKRLLCNVPETEHPEFKINVDERMGV